VHKYLVSSKIGYYEFSNIFQISGSYYCWTGSREFSEKYKRKTFVVKYDTSADYAYDAALVANTKLGMIDDFNVGDSVTRSF
jgi:hypothetical protein